MESKIYQIGEKKYSQKKLVLGQIRQLLNLMGDAGLLQGNEILIPTKITNRDLVDFLMRQSEILSRWIAIVLKEDGVPLAKKDLDAMAEEIEFSIEPETVMEVIRDFFEFLDLNSLFGKVKEMTDEIEQVVMRQIGSKRSRSSSRQETSPKETLSSGDIRPENADLT